jgi:hypothetical protein
VLFLRAGRALCPALLVLAVFVPSANGDSAPICDAHWRAYPSHLGRNGNQLYGAAVLSPHDAWAVGWQHLSNGSYDPLIEHWDGTAWSLSPNPDLPKGSQMLADVDALTSVDAWAVGETRHGIQRVTPLLMHWDGTSWSIVSGAGGVTDGGLFGVSMVSSDDAWAVGKQSGDSTTLIEHWDGSTWSVVPSPSPPRGELDAVATAGSDFGLAVGSYSTQGPFVERWDGSSWTVDRRIPGERLLGVWARSDGRGWVAGSAVARRQDDGTWTRDRIPNASSRTTVDLFGVSGRTTDGGVWAVGTREDASYRSGPDPRTEILRWTGTKWIVAATPNPGSYMDVLQGVAASEPFVWAVGYSESKQSTIPKALILGVC